MIRILTNNCHSQHADTVAQGTNSKSFHIPCATAPQIVANRYTIAPAMIFSYFSSKWRDKMRLIAFLLLVVLLNQQVNSQTSTSIGLKSGVAFSKQKMKHSIIAFDYTEQFTVAVFAEGLSSRYFSVVGEISYVRKGFEHWVGTTTEEQPEGTGESIDTGNKFSYISLAISPKLKYDVGYVTPYVCAGPRVDIQISKRKSQLLLFNAEDSKKALFGYSVGFGLEFSRLLTKTLLLEVMISPDISEAYKEPSTTKNRSIQTVVGIKF